LVLLWEAVRAVDPQASSTSIPKLLATHLFKRSILDGFHGRKARPVSFRLKKEYDGTQPVGFGLIAEEVENVDPALVYCNNKGQVESVHYEMVNAMLLNEFLKEHRKVQEQETTNRAVKERHGKRACSSARTRFENPTSK
jgi:hypothetical protein